MELLCSLLLSLTKHLLFRRSEGRGDQTPTEAICLPLLCFISHPRTSDSLSCFSSVLLDEVINTEYSTQFPTFPWEGSLDFLSNSLLLISTISLPQLLGRWQRRRARTAPLLEGLLLQHHPREAAPPPAGPPGRSGFAAWRSPGGR